MGLMLRFCRRTPQWSWTQTVMQMRKGPMRAGMGRTDPRPVARLKKPPCEPSLLPAPPLALGMAPARAPTAAPVPVWTVPRSRRLVRGPAPCRPPAPQPSHTMNGPIILPSAQWSASTQECRETKVSPSNMHTQHYGGLAYCCVCKMYALDNFRVEAGLVTWLLKV